MILIFIDSNNIKKAQLSSIWVGKTNSIKGRIVEIGIPCYTVYVILSLVCGCGWLCHLSCYLNCLNLKVIYLIFSICFTAMINMTFPILPVFAFLQMLKQLVLLECHNTILESLKTYRYNFHYCCLCFYHCHYYYRFHYRRLHSHIYRGSYHSGSL